MQNLKSKITFRQISGFMMSIVVLALVGLFQLILADFSLDSFKEPDFYIRIIYRVILIILVYNAVINILFDRYIKLDKIQNARKKYIASVKMKDISFDAFLEEYNYKLKANAWISKINKEINKLNRKMENGRRIEKRSKKIKYLETLKTPEYIKQNWAYLNCKWHQLFISDFSVEDAFSNNEVKARSTFNTDVAKWSTKKAAQYIFISLLLGLVVVNMAFDGVKTVEFWFNMLVDLLLVILRATDAGLQLPELIDTNFTNVYLYKVDVMQQYVEWISENNITESKAHKVLSYIQEVEVDKANEKEDKE